MNIVLRSYIYLHIAVFLFGFTGILGYVIDLPAVTLVWWRSLLTWLMLLPYMFYTNGFKHITKRSFAIFAGIGCIVALHWISFYGSIKLANSSVAMICLATISVMTVFCDAWFNKKSILWKDALIGIAIIPGILLIIQNISTQYKLGFFVGLIAAAFSAIFATLNKKFVQSLHSISITWIELFAVWAFITLMLPFYYNMNPEAKFLPNNSDLFYLIILSLFCTVISYVLVLKSLHHISAFSAMLTFNLETIYGIILSIVILHEHRQMNAWFYLGVLLILLSVFLHPYLNKARQKKSK